MIQPSAAGRIDVGLILPGVPAVGRLEPACSFNALFTHRVRVTSGGDLDDALAGARGRVRRGGPRPRLGYRIGAWLTLAP